MMNCFCGMFDRRKAFSIISSRDHCQRSSPSRISNKLWAGFEPVQNLSPAFVEWSCAVVITTTPRRQNILTDKILNWTFDFDELAMSYFTTTQSKLLREPFTEFLELCLGSWFSLSTSLKFVTCDLSSDSIAISDWSSDSLSWPPSDSVSFSVETDMSFSGANEIFFLLLGAASSFPFAALRILIKYLSICRFVSRGLLSLGKRFSIYLIAIQRIYTTLFKFPYQIFFVELISQFLQKSRE